MTSPPFDDQVSHPAPPEDSQEFVAQVKGMPSTFGKGDEPAGEWMSDERLLSIVQVELDSSLGWTGTKIAESRRKNLSEYFANPRGDEREGRSQVVTRDTFETVEWFLPPLMDMFASTGEVCRFTANGPEDENEAEQETDTCNYVFRKNGGFMYLYTAFKDGAVQKNGIGKVWWEDDKRAAFEFYEGKTLVELTLVEQDPNIEILEVTARHYGTMAENEEAERFAFSEVPPEQQMQMVYDVHCRRINRTGRINLENIPPEEFIINRDARGLNDPTCRFVGHRVRTSESNLISWGFDAEVVRNLAGSQSVYTTDQDAIVRASQDDSHPLVYSYRDDSERTIYVNDVWILCDRDGDGISEWWHVVVAGDYGEVLLYAEPAEDHPFVSFTPIPIPHRFYGLALADVTSDIQNINATLWRQGLDSLYLANEPMSVVLSQGVGEAAVPQANLDQLVSRVVGGYVEEYQPNAIRTLETENVMPQVIAAVETHKGMTERRTGISPEAMGVSKDAISPHVYGAMVQTSAAAQRFTLYARIAAETFVRHTFEKISKLLRMHQSEPLVIRLRNEWVPVSPTEWKEARDCIVTVGLGHGSRWERASNIQTVIKLQAEAAQAGLPIVQVENLYQSALTATEAMGFRDASKYWTDPQDAPPQPEEPDPAALAVQQQAMIEMMKVENERYKLQLERYKLMIDAKHKELGHEAKAFELGMDKLDQDWNMRPGPAEAPA